MGSAEADNLRIEAGKVEALREVAESSPQVGGSELDLLRRFLLCAQAGVLQSLDDALLDVAVQ